MRRSGAVIGAPPWLGRGQACTEIQLAAGEPFDDQHDAGAGWTAQAGWLGRIVDSLKEIAPEVEAFLSEVDQDEFTLHWQIETVGASGKLRLLYGEDARSTEEGFTTNHTRLIESFVRDKTREITTEDVMDSVRYRVREYFNSLLASHGLLEDE